MDLTEFFLASEKGRIVLSSYNNNPAEFHRVLAVKLLVDDLVNDWGLYNFATKL